MAFNGLLCDRYLINSLLAQLIPILRGADCAKYWTSPEQSIYANHFNIAVGWTKILCRPARYFIVVVNCCDHALKKSCLMFTISLSSPVHRQIETVDHRETGNNNKCTI